jgi:hypothetical protein
MRNATDNNEPPLFFHQFSCYSAQAKNLTKKNGRTLSENKKLRKVGWRNNRQSWPRSCAGVSAKLFLLARQITYDEFTVIMLLHAASRNSLTT